MTPILPWYELLMKPDADLRRLGLPSRQISEIREQTTGHRRSLAPKWCRSIGLWGRVATQVEIEKVVGCTPKAARRFAERWGLRFAGKYGRLSQLKVATAAYDRFLEQGAAYDPNETARDLHILPIEAKLYPAAVDYFCDENDRDFLWELDESYSTEQLTRMWVNSEAVVRLPRQVLHDIGGGDDFLAARIHRRLGEPPTKELRRNPRTDPSG